MSLTIDVSEIVGFADAMQRVPDVMRRELVTTTNALTAEGAALAQGFAPVDSGRLRGNIRPEHAGGGSGGISGRYLTDLVYSAQREYGGTIHGNPWLVFQVDGRWVKVRSVTQSGSHYMQQSEQALAPRLAPAYSAAVDRALGSAGVA